MKTRDKIRFYLGDELVELSSFPPDRTLLDWLRLKMMLRGTKEGCAEGDCGACTVLVGRIDSEGKLRYETVNACIRFVASLDGTHVVTVEHVRREEGGLHPVQESMVANHGSQCGFCTPGFVMSLYGLWLTRPYPSVAEVEHALQGNLCRCTGYSAIVRAAQAASNYGVATEDPLINGAADMRARLLALRDTARVEIRGPEGCAILPASADDLAMILHENSGATLVSGATDVGLWVNKFLRKMPVIVFLSRVADLESIEIHSDRLVIGGRVSYSDARSAILGVAPQLTDLWNRIGGPQVRNMGTIGGNIANGSPIGDTPPALIVLGAELTLRSHRGSRTMPVEDFFIDYGKQDRKPDEFVERIAIPRPGPDDRIAVYKVTKRADEDISAVLGAFRLRIVEGRVTEARIAYGGMAAIPRRATAVEARLHGRQFDREAIEDAMTVFADDFTPISDWRASAGYRLTVARNLLLRFWAETSGHGPVTVRELSHE
jgi:xanthine dehydrogenase small subunit